MAEILVTKAMLDNSSTDWYRLVAEALAPEIANQCQEDYEELLFLGMQQRTSYIASRKPFPEGGAAELWQEKNDTGDYIYWPACMCEPN